jgi:predicted metal-dependent hydrolase
MDKVEKILERYKIYLGVRDVAVEIRPYKTRDAFTNLSSSPPTIYLNEYLIDDEEILEYLILRELVHVYLHKYPPMRYGRPNLLYSDKFSSVLRFFMPEEKEEKIKEKIMKKLAEANRRLQ